jgi:hypothetical protein
VARQHVQVRHVIFRHGDGFGEAETKAARIRDCDLDRFAADEQPVAIDGRDDAFVVERAEREGDIFTGERVAVGKFQPVAQQDFDAQRVVRKFPTLGQRGRIALRVVIEFDEAAARQKEGD